MYVCIYLYVFMYVCTMCIYVCIYMYMYIYTHTHIYISTQFHRQPISVAAPSKAWVYCRSLAGILGSNLAGRAWMSVSVDCCVLSGRGLCDGLIARPEKSYRLWCVVVCDLETSRMKRPWPTLGRSATEKKTSPTNISSVTIMCVSFSRHKANKIRPIFNKLVICVSGNSRRAA
jgi:hypothetical protein